MVSGAYSYISLRIELIFVRIQLPYRTGYALNRRIGLDLQLRLDIFFWEYQQAGCFFPVLEEHFHRSLIDKNLQGKFLVGEQLEYAFATAALLHTNPLDRHRLLFPVVAEYQLLQAIVQNTLCLFGLTELDFQQDFRALKKRLAQ